MTRKSFVGDKNPSFKHGQSKGSNQSYEYRAWRNAKSRCFLVTHPKYRIYGARGITMCDKWRNDFLAFYNDMGPRPEGMTLERKDVNGNYCPENCKWASLTEQARNKTNNTKRTINGVTKLLREWAEESGVEFYRLKYRLKYYPPEIALNPNVDLRAGRPMGVR